VEADYRVGPGDVLEIEVYDDPDLSGLVTVQHGGEISFPLLGDVGVNGLTAREVRETLTRLLAKDYLVDPQVAVRVKEHRSQWITLVGEVVRPGILPPGVENPPGASTGRAASPLRPAAVVVSRPDAPETPAGGRTAKRPHRIFLSPINRPLSRKRGCRFSSETETSSPLRRRSSSTYPGK
jgi:hypothetical protein